MLRRPALALLLGFLAACARQPVSDVVTIEFEAEQPTVLLSAQTTFDAQARGRVDDARAAAIAGHDPWSLRFAQLSPESERTVLDRRRGVLERVSRSARIDPRDLQRFFSDVSVTVKVTDGEGWRELALYPGTSTRASREQRRRFDERMGLWSRAVARYFTTVHHFYAYLRENPRRAEPLFAALFQQKGPDGTPFALTEDEQPLVDAVDRAVDDVLRAVAGEEESALDLAQEADLLFNPFPARIVVKVPGTLLETRGFTRDLTIEPVDLAAAVTALEGRWISPDPGAILLREDQPMPSAAAIATMERRSSAVVNASELEAALREQLARPNAYVVRWRG